MRRRTLVATVMTTALVLGAGCSSSERVRLVPGETLPPLPPRSSTGPRPTTTVPVPTYLVQRGDTLLVVARRLGVEVAALVEANALADPDRLVEGQVLVVPPTSTTVAG